MSSKVIVAIAAVSVLGVGLVVALRQRAQPSAPSAPEAADQVVVDFALGHLKATSKDAVLTCGASLADQELDAQVKVVTLSEGVQVDSLAVTKTSLSADAVGCVSKVFVGTHAQRQGPFADRIPAGREYELDAHLVLPRVSASY
jgi:hypothetical protein